MDPWNTSLKKEEIKIIRPILYVKSHGKHCQINDAKPLIIFRIGCIFFGMGNRDTLLLKEWRINDKDIKDMGFIGREKERKIILSQNKMIVSK